MTRPRIPLKGWGEQGALTGRRHFLHWRPGVLKAIKRGHNRRARRVERREDERCLLALPDETPYQNGQCPHGTEPDGPIYQPLCAECWAWARHDDQGLRYDDDPDIWRIERWEDES